MTDVVTITDTGKRRTTSVTAEETDIANSGTTITLKGVELTVDDKALLDTNPVLSKYASSSDSGSKWAYGEVNTTGMEKPKWIARGLLRDTDTTDMALIKALRDLPRTKGYKTLGGDLPDWTNGADDASTVNVHVSSVKIMHRSRSNLIDYTIEMFETE